MIATFLMVWYRGRYRLTRFLHGFATKPNELVLDIGSGDSPFPATDVVCEKFPWDDTERTQGFLQDRPLVVGDAEDLPFRDKSFDFIYSSHVLEHVYHPEKAIQELMRVGKRGYIEMPRWYLEKGMKSTAGHLWFVDIRDGKLVFKPKPKGVLDSEMNDLHQNELINRDPLFSAFYYARFYSLLHIRLFWEGTISYVIEGGRRAEPEQSGDDFEKATTDAEGGQKKAPPRSTFARLIKKLVRRRASKKNFDLEKLLACPSCKGPVEKREPESVYVCPRCAVSYPIRSGVPVLLKESAKTLALSHTIR
jgi:uncharacterized protein YbaR (Trm112 family)